MEQNELQRAIMAILFAAGEPVSVQRLSESLETDPDEIRREAETRFEPARIGAICGSDIDPQALELCKRHVKQAGLGGRITVSQRDLRSLCLEGRAPFFLLNPPYGERLADCRSCEGLYRELRMLWDRHPGSGMGVITAHTGFERCFGRRAEQKRRLYNGRLECEFLRFTR